MLLGFGPGAGRAVDSITTSTPRSPRGSSLSAPWAAKARIRSPSIAIPASAASMLPWKPSEHRVVLEQVRERPRVDQVDHRYSRFRRCRRPAERQNGRSSGRRGRIRCCYAYGHQPCVSFSGRGPPCFELTPRARAEIVAAHRRAGVFPPIRAQRLGPQRWHHGRRRCGGLHADAGVHDQGTVGLTISGLQSSSTISGCASTIAPTRNRTSSTAATSQRGVPRQPSRRGKVRSERTIVWRVDVGQGSDTAW